MTVARETSLTKICHIVETFSMAEWTAYNRLLEGHIDSYLPYVLADRRHGRWIQGHVRPQFPGYLFVTVEIGQSLEPVLKTIGVRNILRNGGNYVAMPKSQLDKIHQQCEKRREQTMPKLIDVKTWKVGDVVPAPYGPFAGLPVEIKSIDKSGRVRASIGNLSVTFHIEVAVQQTVPSMAARAQSSANAVS